MPSLPSLPARGTRGVGVASAPVLPSLRVVHLYEHTHDHHHFHYPVDEPDSEEEELSQQTLESTRHPRDQKAQESSRPSKASNGPRNEERSRQASKEKARSSSVPRIVVETCEESSTSAAPRQEGPSPLLVPAAPSPSRGSMVSLAESSLDGESKPRRSIRRKVQEEDPLTLRLKQMDNENVWSDYRRQLKRHIRDLPDSSKSRAKQQLLGQRVTGTSKDKARLEHLKARDKEEHRELVHHVEAELRACARSRYKVLRMQEVLKRRLRPKVDFGGVAGLLA
ncbi:unnamed protein product [Effrenium voratum]|nr:unnamed protein product [Effrenium voratum]